jgi:2-oxoglutarate dehydrogenase E1 component
MTDICKQFAPKAIETRQMKDFSYITNSHPAYIESLYKDFVKDPASVDQDLQKFFEGFDFAVSSGVNTGNGQAVAETAASFRY